jgi:hypothetical protein
MLAAVLPGLQHVNASVAAITCQRTLDNYEQSRLANILPQGVPICIHCASVSKLSAK